MESQMTTTTNITAFLAGLLTYVAYSRYKAHKTIEDLKIKLNTHKKNHKELIDQIDILSDHKLTQLRDIEEKVTQVARLDAALTEAQLKMDELVTELKKEESMVSSQKKIISTLKRKLDTTESNNENLEVALSDFRLLEAGLRKENTNLLNQVEFFKTSSKTYEKSLEDMSNSLIELEDTYNKYKSTSEKRIKELDRDKRHLAEEYDLLEQTYDDLKSSYSALESTLRLATGKGNK
jgi:chromosome segregation ATPase